MDRLRSARSRPVMASPRYRGMLYRSLEAMFHQSVDHQVFLIIGILRIGKIGGFVIVLGRAVQKIEAEVHFRQRSDFAETGNSDFGAFRLRGLA